MEESELDKSEEATPFKLKRAREKGAVARSLDLGFFAALAAALAFLWVGGPRMAVVISGRSGEVFSSAGTIGNSPEALLSIVPLMFAPIVYPMIAFAAALFAIALILDFLQVGPVFSATPLKPDFSRINPAKGLKRLFSWRMLIEAAKALFKLAVYSTIAWLVISNVLDNDAQAINDGTRLGGVIFSTLIRLVMFCALAALAFAAIDQMLVRREFSKKMRMSRRELKREHRDREGEPRMKQKRKQLHVEFTKAAKALRDVKGSDIIITNPEHYAIALRYDPARMAAPSIVAMGAGGMAQRIKRLGFVYGVLIVHEPALARGLFRAGRTSAEIPSEFYQSIADLYLRFDIVSKKAAN